MQVVQALVEACDLLFQRVDILLRRLSIGANPSLGRDIP